MAFVVYSFGEIEFWDQFLGAIKNVIGSGDYAVLAALFLSLGLVWKALNEGKNPGGIAWYFITLAILSGLLKGSVDVIVRDEILNRDRLIHNVPIIVALPAYLVTNVERALTNLFETNFSLPEGVRYLDFGYDIGSYVFKNSFAYPKLNAYYDRSWTNFVKDCVVPSISQGRINANDLIHSSDIETVLDNVNPAYTTEYCDLSGNCQNMYCNDAWNRIKQDTQTLLTTARNSYVAKVLTEKEIYSLTTAQKLESDFANISDYFLNYSVDLNNFVKQTLVIHELAQGFNLSLSSDDLIIRYMEEVAKIKTNSILIALGELAGNYVPLLKKLLLFLLFGSLPILFLLLYVDYLRSKALFSFFTVLFSLTLWDPLFAILNLIISIIQQNKYQACEIGTNALSMVHFACLTNDATTMAGVAGALAWSVPTLALGLAGGSTYALVSGLGGILSRASSGLSGSIATPEGAESVGKTYAKMEEAQRLGFNYEALLKTESQTYTQQVGANMLALSGNPDFFLQKSELDIAKTYGTLEAYSTGKDLDLSKAMEVSSINTQRDIGHAEALKEFSQLTSRKSVKDLIKEGDLAKGRDLSVSSIQEAKKLADYFKKHGVNVSPDKLLGSVVHLSFTSTGDLARADITKGGKYENLYTAKEGSEYTYFGGQDYGKVEVPDGKIMEAIINGTPDNLLPYYDIARQVGGKASILGLFEKVADTFNKKIGINISLEDAKRILSDLGLEGEGLKVVSTGGEIQVITSDGKKIDFTHLLATQLAYKGKEGLVELIQTLHDIYSKSSDEIGKGLTHRHFDNLISSPEGVLVGVGNGLLGAAALKGLSDFLRKNYSKFYTTLERINLDQKVGRALGLTTLFPEARGEHLKELRALRDTLKKELFTRDELNTLTELSKQARNGDTQAAKEYLKMWENKLSELKKTNPEKFNQIAERVSELIDLRSTDALTKLIEKQGVHEVRDTAKEVLKGMKTIKEEGKLLKLLKFGGKAVGALEVANLAMDAPSRLTANDDIAYLFNNPNSNKAIMWQAINVSDWLLGYTYLIGNSVYPDVTEQDINLYYAGYLLTAGDTPIAKALLENMPNSLIEKSLSTYLGTLNTQKVAVIQTKNGEYLPIYIDKEGYVYNLKSIQEAGFKIDNPNEVPLGAIQYRIGYYQDGQLHLYDFDELKGENLEKIPETIRNTVDLTNFRDLERKRAFNFKNQDLNQ